MKVYFRPETPENIQNDFEIFLKLNKHAFHKNEKVTYTIEKNMDISDFSSISWIQRIEADRRENSLFDDLFYKNKKPVFIAGPCSVEDEDMILTLGSILKDIGVHVLRGGTYKTRTSAFDFQGLKKEGIDFLLMAGKKNNLPIVSEMTSINQAEDFFEKVDIIQIGARNMQNFPLIEVAASLEKPLLIKRGAGATISEYIKALEYAFIKGNGEIILCERGIRTFENKTRYTLDISAIPILKKETGLPVLADPSHATGDSSLVYSMSMAAIAAGSDGVMLEVHENPIKAKSDAKQQISPLLCEKIIKKANKIYTLLSEA